MGSVGRTLPHANLTGRQLRRWEQARRLHFAGGSFKAAYLGVTPYLVAVFLVAAALCLALPATALDEDTALEAEDDEVTAAYELREGVAA